MKINYQTREELRRMVEAKLKNVPEGTKIHIDVNLLAELLFEEEILDQTTGNIGKIPVWTGDFLRKIDLSEVSFDGVCWDAEGYLSPQKEKKYSEAISNIDFSYTNANIDFTKAFQTTPHHVLVINCNFEGLDLSNNDLSNIQISFDSTNLTGTKLNLQNSKNASSNNCSVGTYCSNLSGLDLSWLTVDLENFTQEQDSFTIEAANFSHTGLRIIGNVDELDEFGQENLKEAIRDGRLEGCYINGILIKPMKSDEEMQARKNQMKSEYEQLRADLISQITDEIDAQIIAAKNKK